jgi:large subunit ribosomal protein L17
VKRVRRKLHQRTFFDAAPQHVSRRTRVSPSWSSTQRETFSVQVKTIVLVSVCLNLCRTLITELFKHERIETTYAKAKSMQPLAERMVTLAKNNKPHAWNRAGQYVREKPVLGKLFGHFVTRYEDREGGYTRIVKTRRRLGDHALMAFIEMVDR